MRRFVDAWRPSAITLGAPAFPLFVLLGLNTVDELDRAAFAVLLPEIRDHFGLTDASALGLVSLTTIAVLLVGIPLGFYADRRSRVRLATGGAAIWTLLSLGTGAAVGVAMLGVARLGAGVGRAVVVPTHSSLLADWYPPAARVRVFAVHRLASSVGQVVGPLVAGLLALWWGWRAPFFVFAIPALVFVALALRLEEPARGASEAAGPDPAGPLSARESVRALWRVRTIRRMWFASPFLGLALFAVPNLLGLVYEDVFGLSAAERGAVAAGVEPLQIVGVLLGMPLVARVASGQPDTLLRGVAVLTVVDGLIVVALSYAPSLPVAIGLHALLAATVSMLAPAFLALVSLVAPAHVRSAAFSTMAVGAIPGIVVFLPVIGLVSDRLGIQASLLTLVPISTAGALLLASARGAVRNDMADPLATGGSHADERRTLGCERVVDGDHRSVSSPVMSGWGRQ